MAPQRDGDDDDRFQNSMIRKNISDLGLYYRSNLDPISHMFLKMRREREIFLVLYSGGSISGLVQAIALCPDVVVYWTNRAICHCKRNDWKKVEEDCIRAIQLDPNSVKAHYMLGRALLKKHEYSEGIKELKRVLDLGGRGANPKSYIVGDIWKEFTTAKYLEWERESSKRLWDLQSLKVACEHALVEKQFLDSSQLEGVSDEDINAISAQLELLGRVFDKAAEVDLPTEVPDHLCCKISYDIFYDPVITPTGITYERAVIVDHLQKVGNFDPVTREPLDQSQLIPNLSIKEAVQAFLDNHGWAYKMD